MTFDAGQPHTNPAALWPPTPHMKKLQYSVREFAHDLIDVLNDYEGDMTRAYDRAAPIIQKLLGNAELLQVGEPRKANHAASSTWLYFDYELEVQLSGWQGGMPVPVHDHGTWEFIAPLQGEFEYTSYRRLDDGSVEGVAELEVVEQRLMVRGDAAVTGLPPNDIHSFTPLTDDSLILGMNHGPLSKVRHYYDPAQSSVTVRDAKAWRENQPQS